MRLRTVALASLCLLVLVAGTANAKVVHNNVDDLPPGCDAVSGDVTLTVRGGRNHTVGFPGTMYTFDEHEWAVEPCARVTVTFINDDPIRHQYMVHGTWPEGFTLLEVDGPGQETGTFIAPSRPTTLLVHCGVHQHQQKGMKAQLLVGGGIGDLPNIPGISGVPPDEFEGHGGTVPSDESESQTPSVGGALAGIVVGLAALVGRRWRGRR